MSGGSIVDTVKSQLKLVLKFFKVAFEECITVGKDLWDAFKFARTNSDNKSEWWNGIKRNWLKSIRCIGFVFVLSGLNLNLGTIVFVLVSLVVRGLIISHLDNLQKTDKIESSKDKSVKKYVIYTVLRFLIPVIVLFTCVAHWWLLLPGLLMMCVGNLSNKIIDDKFGSFVWSGGAKSVLDNVKNFAMYCFLPRLDKERIDNDKSRE